MIVTILTVRPNDSTTWLVDFSTLWGDGYGLWHGTAPLRLSEYNVELDIPDELIWGKDVVKATTRNLYLFRDEGTRYAPAMIDLKSASRDDLIRLVVAQHERIAALESTVAEQRAVIATLEATVAQLTQRVGELLAAEAARSDDAAGTGRPHGMPGLKPAPAKPRPPKGPRKRRGQQFVRQRMEPTQQVIHAVEHCPTCGLVLTGGSVKRRREVIEVPLVPAVVTEHVSLERCCPHCRTRHTPAVDLGEAVVGKQRFGVGLVSLIATLREEARLPVATIQCGCPRILVVTVHGGW
jgi:hypothetical protein